VSGGVVLITDVAFWRGGAGHRERICALARYLSAQMPLTTVYLGGMRVEDLALAEGLGVGGKILALKSPISTPEAVCAGLHRLIASVRPRAVLFEYLRLNGLLPGVPAGVLKMVDIHDIVSERDAAFLAAGAPLDRPALGTQEELDLLSRFDRILAISLPEKERLAAALGGERVLYVPHAVQAEPCETRPYAKTVGFVGSRYAPNVDGVRWLVGEIWPRVNGHQLRLAVFGTVCDALADWPAGVEPRGMVPDTRSVYEEIDIAVNPVRFGAGLKIKTVEALAHGMPLVTTAHGASGMEDGAGHAFMVADHPADFAAAISRLASDAAARRALASAGAAYAASRFSPDAAFGELKGCLLEAGAAS